MDILMKNGRVYTENGFIDADVSVCADNGAVSAVTPDIPADGFDVVFDCANMLIVPGLADVHTHLREPGFCCKETIATGTAAAAHGGYTEIYTMPNLSPVPDSVASMAQQLEAIERDALIDVRPYASITRGEKGGELSDMEALAPYAAGFSDDGKGVQNEDMMRAAMLRAKALGKPIVAHCEDESLLRGGYIHDGEYAAAHGHRGICSESEWRPIARDIELVRETGCRYHVCHVSTAESVEIIRRAKADGLPVTCETGPHYLILCDEDLQEDGRFKMNPPLRSRRDRDALIEGIKDGMIDVIATDHAPHTAEEKSRGLEKSLMGVVGLETAFAVMYTYLVRPGIITLEKLIELMCVDPRRLFEPQREDVCVKAGGSADIAVIRLFDGGVKIDPSTFLSKGRATPFEGMEVNAEVMLTLYKGKIVWRK